MRFRSTLGFKAFRVLVSMFGLGLRLWMALGRDISLRVWV